MEPCIKEKEINNLYSEVSGLAKTIPRIEEKLDNLISVVAELRTSVFAFGKFQNETVAIKRYKANESEISWKKAGIIISGILGFSGIICTLILKLL